MLPKATGQSNQPGVRSPTWPVRSQPGQKLTFANVCFEVVRRAFRMALLPCRLRSRLVMKTPSTASMLALLLLIPCVGNSTDLPPEYMRATGQLAIDVRGVKWLRDLCVQEVPDSRPSVDAAYAEWEAKHGKFADEVEQTIPFIASQSQKSVGSGRGLSAERINAMLEQQHEAYRSRMLSAGAEAVKSLCERYPEWAQSSKADPEVSHSDLVNVMRRYQH